MKRALPTADQVRQAMDEVVQEAAATGRRPTVAAVERRLGIAHPTFYRNYRDLISQYFQPRVRNWPTPLGSTTSGTAMDRPANGRGSGDGSAEKATERWLRQQIADLRKTVHLYEEAIRQLAIENEDLRAQLTAVTTSGNVTALRPVERPAQRH